MHTSQEQLGYQQRKQQSQEPVTVTDEWEGRGKEKDSIYS